MKKIWALILASLMLSLVACGNSNNPNSTGSTSGEEHQFQIEYDGSNITISRDDSNENASNNAPATSLELGETYEIPDYAEITLISISTTNKVSASMNDSHYYENRDDGETYIDVIFDVKNLSTETISCDELMTATAITSAGAEYTDVLYCGEKAELTDITANAEINPLGTLRFHAAISLPVSEKAVTLNFNIADQVFSYPYSINTEVKQTTPLAVGDIIENPDYASMEFLGYEFSDTLLPSNTNGVYSYKQVDDADSTMLILKFNVTNYQSVAKDTDTFVSANATFMDKYQYRGQFEYEEADGTGFSLYNLDPLTTAKAFCIIQVPKSIMNEAFTVDIMFDKQEYVFTNQQ